MGLYLSIAILTYQFEITADSIVYYGLVLPFNRLDKPLYNSVFIYYVLSLLIKLSVYLFRHHTMSNSIMVV